jgi:hypothetical protein
MKLHVYTTALCYVQCATLTLHLIIVEARGRENKTIQPTHNLRGSSENCLELLRVGDGDKSIG